MTDEETAALAVSIYRVEKKLDTLLQIQKDTLGDKFVRYIRRSSAWDICPLCLARVEVERVGNITVRKCRCEVNNG